MIFRGSQTSGKFFYCKLDIWPNAAQPCKEVVLQSYDTTCGLWEREVPLNQFPKCIGSRSGRMPTFQHVKLLKHFVDVGSRHGHFNGVLTSGDATSKKTDRSTGSSTPSDLKHNCF